MNTCPIFFALIAAAASSALAAEPVSPPRDVLFNCPDPAVIQPREDGPTYVFSTGRGVPIFRSDDLLHWERIGHVFDRGAPAWATAAVPGADSVWAPDIRWFNERYYLYYAVSTFGSQRSAIGLAVNKMLDPAKADYRWEDRGLVLDSSPEKSDFNAIDPAMFVDRNGNPYLFWGSYWTGIKAALLDPATGKLPSGKPQVTAVAARSPGVSPPAIEAPYVLYHEGYYYLFVSWDACCDEERSTYKVVVGRAKSVLGPYLDYHGHEMSEGGGTLVVASYGKWRGPGHNSALCTSHGDYMFLAGFDAENLRRRRVLQVRRMYWSPDGWPVVGEAISAAEKAGSPDMKPSSAAGTWKTWTDFNAEASLVLGGDGKMSSGSHSGTWRQNGAALTLEWKNHDPQAVVLEAGGSCFVGRDARGKVIFGKR